jgi:hypothetical protein
MKAVAPYCVGSIEGQPLPPQQHEYSGYRIIMRQYGGGWRATIYAPGGDQPILGPQSNDPMSYDDILAEAKRLIDALLSS